MRKLISYTCILVVFGGIISCQEPQLDAVGEVYLDLPTTRYEYNNFNDTTNAISTLGRVLFYDRQLSINNTISCASCHKQSSGFADNVRFSRGFEMGLTTRNSMPLQNIGSFPFFLMDAAKPALSSSQPAVDPRISSSSFFFGGERLFWDGRETSLEELALQPVGNHIEMGITDINALAVKLSKLPYYSSLFNDAFNSPSITADRISTAIASFVSSIRTDNTKFDQFNRSAVFDPENPTQQPKRTGFNSLELEGMMLFETKYECNSCHNVGIPNGYLFTGTFANIGLDPESEDPGLRKTTGNPSDNGKFKIPSLRNIVYTAPYMHDGRFATLEEVIDHYSDGIEDDPNLDERLRDASGHARSMNITPHEKQAIIAFLRTLSDESVITDPRFSNPFKLK